MNFYAGTREGEPVISIIIPIYNGFRTLDPAVLQADTEKEILLVNDGSEDDSAAVCARYAAQYPDMVRFIDKAHSGVSDTRNAGIRAARGKYLMFLDADDTLRPGSVEALVRFFDACGEAVDLVTYPIETLYHGWMLPPHFRYRYLTYSGIYDLRTMPYIGQTTMNIVVRNRFADNVLFDTGMTFSEDQKYCCEVLHARLKMGFCKDAAYIYHRSEESSSGRLSGACYIFEQSMAMFEEIFDRYPGRVPAAFQGLYINDLAWKLRSNILYPWHYDAPAFAKAQARIHALLQRVEDEVIWNHPEIDPFHKCWWLSRKPNTRAEAFFEADGFGLRCGDAMLQKERRVPLMLTRIRRDGDTLLFRGFLKSGTFLFTQEPALYAVTPQGRTRLALYPSSHSYYLCRTQVCRFHAFCLELPAAAFRSLRFEMELGGFVYGCTCDFLPKVGFSRHTARYSTVVGDLGLRFDPAGECFLPDERPPVEILLDNSDNPLIPYRLARLRRRAARLRKTQRIHLYYDCRGVEKDNGYYRFLADAQRRDGIERYYVCTLGSAAQKQLFPSKLRRRVLAFGSRKHRIYALAAEKIITAFIEDNNILPFAPEELPLLSDFFGFTVEYLQHGILHASVPWKYTPEAVLADKLCISTEYERRLFTQKYHFRAADLLPVLMPRLSQLDREKHAGKRILFAPSWREYLIGANVDGVWQPRHGAFLASDYYRGLCTFLQSPALHAFLEAQELTLDFKLHPIFACYRGHFESSHPRIRIVERACPPEEYAMFLTDFSSYLFDFLYLGRPVFSYIPDMQQFACGMNTYREIEPESRAMQIPVRSAEEFCEAAQHPHAAALAFYEASHRAVAPELYRKDLTP